MSSAATAPEPMSWPTAVCAPCETIDSSAEAPVAEELLVDGELDAARTEMVGDTERKALGNGGPADAEGAARPQVDLARDLVAAQPAPEQLVDPELLERRDLDAE